MASTVDEGKLIGTRCVVDNELVALFVLLLVRDDCVAEAEGLEESFQVGIVFVIAVLDLLPVLRVFKVHVSHSSRVFKRRGIVRTILDGASREAFEFHNILSQSSSLVTKDVVNHTELFIQVG